MKTREVPDWVNYSLLFSALGVRSIFAVANGWSILISGIIGFLVCLMVAYFFYYTDQWGGGDSKLLMALGMVIGVSFPFSSESFTLFWFLLGVLLLGAIYGLFWMGLLAIRHRHEFSQQFSTLLRRHKVMQGSVLGISVLLLGVQFTLFTVWPLILFIIGIFYLMLFVKSVERGCFFTEKPVEEITEGDWLAEEVIHNGKYLLKKKTLQKEDVALLQSLKNMKVLIKEGIPFTPSFLLAYLVIIFNYDFWITLWKSFLG